MLRFLGARSYRFDLKEFSDKEYEFRLLVDEYVMGKKVEKDLQLYVEPNWGKRYQDPESWNKFLEENKPKLSTDGQKYLFFENMGIYIVSKNDSISTVGFNFYGGRAAFMPLKLKTVENVEQPMYDCRPFKIYPVSSKSQRIPFLYGK